MQIKFDCMCAVVPVFLLNLLCFDSWEPSDSRDLRFNVQTPMAVVSAHQIFQEDVLA